MRGNKLLLLVLAILVIGGTAVFGIGAFINNTGPSSESNRALDKEVLAEPVHTINGVITSVDDGTQLLIRRATAAPASVGPKGPDERTVMITDKTSLAALVPLTGKDLSSAMKAYQNKLKNDATAMPPPPYKEVPIDPSDLRITMDVMIASNQDIRTAPTITADKITFYAPPSTPPTLKK